MTVDKIKIMDWTKYGIFLPQHQIIDVIDWNIERKLHESFDIVTETALLQEEALELSNAIINEDLHEMVDANNDMLVVFIGTVLKYLLHKNTISLDLLPKIESYISDISEQLKGSLDDIKELGFEPKCAFNETLLEINSRVGKINPNTGKWEKDKSESAKAKWYKANYDLCKLK